MKSSKGLWGFVLAVVLVGCSKPSEQAAPKQEDFPKAVVQTTPAQQASGNLEVSPSQLKSGQTATLKFVMKDSKGEPIRDASVRATITMPMGKSEMKDQVDLKWNGTSYNGTVKATMAGTWDVAVEAKREGKLVLSLPSQIDVK